MRVRLIFKFTAVLHRLDTSAMAVAGDYDDEFGEPRVRSTAGVRSVSRKEWPEVRLKCQVEDAESEKQRMVNTGNTPEHRLGLVFDYRELKALGLVDPASGIPLLRVNDRLSSIYDGAGALVELVRDPPGLYAVQVTPISYGIGSKLNLLLVLFNDVALGKG